MLKTLRASSHSKCSTSLSAVESILHWDPEWAPHQHHLVLWSAHTTRTHIWARVASSVCVLRSQPSALRGKLQNPSGSCLPELPAWCSTEQGVKSPLRTPKGHQMLLVIRHPRVNHQLSGFLTLFGCSFTNALLMSHSLVLKVLELNDRCPKLDLQLNELLRRF